MSSDDNAEARFTPPAPPSTIDPGDAIASSSTPAWSCTVSVRALCEFTAKHCDLDRRFTPSATALEGLLGQQAVAGRRSQDYETEIALEGLCGTLRVRGRADGYEPRRRCLEEVKTIRGHPDDIPENRRRLHWAQLQTYGALFCRVRGLPEVIFERSGLRKLRVEKSKARQMDDLCDRFNVTAV